MTLKEMLGENYKDDITVEEIATLISDKKFVDLSNGEYVSKGKLTEAEKAIKAIRKEYDEYKTSKQTDEEKKAEIEAAEKARIEGIETEIKKLRAKEQLFDNGYSKEEINYLMENDNSPSAFATIMENRVKTATQKSVALDIKEHIEPPTGGTGNLETEPTSLRGALQEKYSS